MKIGILTDTTNCLPPDSIERYGIRVVPVGLVIDNKPYRDQVEITPAEFWERFNKARTLPSTTAPTPGDFEAAFAEMAQAGFDHILCILVSKILSGTQNSAALASRTFLEDNPGRIIEIIDSKCAAGALGFLVLEAARAAEKGQSFEQIVQVVNGLLPRVTYLTALESLRYLIKGGRAPRIAMIGNFLGVRPIITNDKETGEVFSLERGRGKQKTMEKLVDTVADFAEPDKPLHMMVHFTTSLADGEKLRDMVTARYECEELYLTPYTPVMAAHTGPVLSLAFYA